MKNFINKLKNYFGLDVVEEEPLPHDAAGWRDMALSLQKDLQETQGKLNVAKDENWKLRRRLALYAEMVERGNQNG